MRKTNWIDQLDAMPGATIAERVENARRLMMHKIDPAKMLTLVMLYRLLVDIPEAVLMENGTDSKEVADLIDRLEAVTFPPCFEPIIPKTIATAQSLIAAASCAGSA